MDTGHDASSRGLDDWTDSEWRTLMMARLFAICLVLGGACFTATAELYGAEWQAGIAKANITPQEPIWMSGYASRSHGADGKLTELWAKAIVIADPAGQRIVAVTLDVVGLDRP